MNEKGEQEPIRSYVHVDLPDEGPVYVTTARAMSEDELREQVLREAMAGLEAWRKRYADLAELPQKLVREIDRTLSKKAAKPKRRPKAARRPELVATP